LFKYTQGTHTHTHMHTLYKHRNKFYSLFRVRPLRFVVLFRLVLSAVLCFCFCLVVRSPCSPCGPSFQPLSPCPLSPPPPVYFGSTRGGAAAEQSVSAQLLRLVGKSADNSLFTRANCLLIYLHFVSTFRIRSRVR